MDGKSLPERSGEKQEEITMWTKPSYTDLRIGFEVTMYFASR